MKHSSTHLNNHHHGTTRLKSSQVGSAVALNHGPPHMEHNNNEEFHLNKSGFSAVSVRSSNTSSLRSEKATNLNSLQSPIAGKGVKQKSSVSSLAQSHNLSSYFEVDDEVQSETTEPQDLESIVDGSKSLHHAPVNNFAIGNGVPESMKSSKNHQQTDQHHEKIMKHFYMESDEESIPEPRVYSPQQQQSQRQQYHLSPQSHHSQSRSVSSKTSTKKNTSMEQHHPQPAFPMYPNPYQFFPYFNNFPFFSPPFPGNAMNSDSINEMQRPYPNSVKTSDDTFITDRSVERSFFEKEQHMENLISESREMKKIIQQQSELIHVILKKLDEVNGKLDEMKAKETIITVPKRDINNETELSSPLKSNHSSSRSTQSVNNKQSKLDDVKTESPSRTSSINHATSNNHFPSSDKINLKQSPPSSPIKPVTNSTESHRYSNSVPSLSNSPIKPIQKQTTPKSNSGHIPNSNSRLSASSSSNLYGFSGTQVSEHTKYSTPKNNYLQNLSSSISNLKDYGSPKSPSNHFLESHKKKTHDMDDSLLNSSRLTDSIDLYGDSHGEDSFVYNASCMSSCSSTPPEPFSTDMQRYLHENILSANGSKKDDMAKDSEQTFVKKKDYSTYSSPGIPLKSFSKID